jgi:hypothetical protein
VLLVLESLVFVFDFIDSFKFLLGINVIRTSDGLLQDARLSVLGALSQVHGGAFGAELVVGEPERETGASVVGACRRFTIG